MQGDAFFDCYETRYYIKYSLINKHSIILSSKKKEVWTIIQRYVTGSATPEEIKKLKKWMNQSAEISHLVSDVKDIWDNTPEEKFQVNVEKAWDRFKALNIENENSHYEVVRPPKTILYIYRIAALILVSLFAAYVVYTQDQLENSRLQQEEIVMMQEITTDAGDKAQVTFSDGSRVVVNSSTRIDFPKTFRNQKREVFLEGEAYFEVKHDPVRPFIVHNKEVEIEVLGTKFNVRGWQEDDQTEVVVENGKVSVKTFDETANDMAEAILTKGTFTTVQHGSAPSTVQKVDVKNKLVWLSGGLHFDKTPFWRVIQDIERRFNVTVKIQNSELEETLFTSTFSEADLNEVINVISSTMEISYEAEGNEIVFRN